MWEATLGAMPDGWRAVAPDLRGFGASSLPADGQDMKAMAGDRERCLEAGANDYIAKPVNVDVLLATLWRTLQGQPA